MGEIYLKLGKLISDILLYGKDVHSVSAVFIEDDQFSFRVTSSNGSQRVINVPMAVLAKVHDHSLDNYVLDVMREQELLGHD